MEFFLGFEVLGQRRGARPPSGQAQRALAQPLQAEEQQQDADRARRSASRGTEARSDRPDDDRRAGRTPAPRRGADQRVRPAAGNADGEHDGQGFDQLDADRDPAPRATSTNVIGRSYSRATAGWRWSRARGGGRARRTTTGGGPAGAGRRSRGAAALRGRSRWPRRARGPGRCRVRCARSRPGGSARRRGEKLGCDSLAFVVHTEEDRAVVVCRGEGDWCRRRKNAFRRDGLAPHTRRVGRSAISLGWPAPRALRRCRRRATSGPRRWFV